MSDTPPPPPPPPPPSAPPPPPPMGSMSGGTGPGGLPLAEAWMRLVARVLDGLIVGIVFGFVFAAIVLSGDGEAGVAGFGVDASFGDAYLIAILGVAAGFVWDAVCTKMFGGSPMKLAFGMKVVQTDGSDVEWQHAIKRWALPGAFSLIPLPVLPGLASLIVVIVSLVFLFSKPLRTALWDLFAGTLVVRSR